MYSQGENFYYDIDGDEYELTVLENFIFEGRDYVVSEDFDGEIYVFLYDEDEEEIFLVEDKKEKKSVIEYWKNEYRIENDISDFEDDEYYDREDEMEDRDFDDDEYYIDSENDDYY